MRYTAFPPFYPMVLSLRDPRSQAGLLQQIAREWDPSDSVADQRRLDLNFEGRAHGNGDFKGFLWWFQEVTYGGGSGKAEWIRLVAGWNFMGCNGDLLKLNSI